MPVEISGKVWKFFTILVAVILPAGFSAPRWKVKFVKAFGYTDGRLSGRLLVMKRTELARHAGEGQYDHYSTIRLAEG